jgi:hypothetical protein
MPKNQIVFKDTILIHKIMSQDQLTQEAQAATVSTPTQSAILVGKKVGEYVKNGNSQFVYELNISGDVLDSYKKDKGAYYRESENGLPLHWSNTPIQTGSELTKTAKGGYVVLADLEGQVEAEKAATTMALGKLNAIAKFTGLSKAQMAEKLLASF